MNLKKSIKVAVLTLVLGVLLGMVGTLTEGPRPIGYAHFWDVFSAEASVTPVINGTISAGEWDAAHMEAFTSLGFYTHDENAATCYADSGETDGFDVHLRGRVDKGPFIIGSLVSVSLINDSGHPTGEVFNTHTINNQGQFELELPLPRYTSMEANGFYYNEVTGELSVAPIWLRAFYEITGGRVQDANINVITHLSYERVKALLVAGVDFETAISQAEWELTDALGVGLAGFDPGEDGSDMNILGGDTDANAYLFAVSAVLVKVAQLRGGPTDARLQELINTVSDDLEVDGELNPGVTDELHEAECALDPVHVMDLLQDRFEELGSSAEVPDIRRIIDCDDDGVVNADDWDDRDPEATFGPLSVSVSTSATPICGPKFSHKLKVSWKVTGGKPPVDVTIEITKPDGLVESVGVSKLEGERTFRLHYPGGGTVGVKVNVQDAAGSSASASATASLASCSGG